MRKLLGVLFATLFTLGVSGAAMANCPYSHDKTETETTEDQQTS